MTKNVVLQSAEYRAKKLYKEAVEVVESNLSSLNDETRLPALLNAFYSAKEAGNIDKAKEIASLIYNEDPNIPSIKDFLD